MFRPDSSTRILREIHVARKLAGRFFFFPVSKKKKTSSNHHKFKTLKLFYDKKAKIHSRVLAYFKMNNSIMYNENVEILQTMLTVERSEPYTAKDYLRRTNNNNNDSATSGFPVDPPARDSIAEWFVSVCDACNYDVETAEIAISLLDRFAANPNSQDVVDERKTYQLASLAAIYTSAKVFEQEALSPNFMTRLSGGINSRGDVEGMEMRMLKALGFRVNKPTAMSFVRLLLEIVSDVFDEDSRKLLMSLTTFQIRCCLIKYEYSLENASSIAVASLLNSVHWLYNDVDLLRSFQALISRATINTDLHSLDNLRKRISELSNTSDAISELLQTQRKQKLYSAYGGYESTSISKSRNQPYQNSPKNVTMLR